MKQNKQGGSIIALALIFIGISIIMLSNATERDIARLEKYDSCLTQAITELPDPNDTTERSILLANCMDK